MKILLKLLLLFTLPTTQALPLSNYIERNCRGETNIEVSGTTIDCLMEEHVVVFDYSKQWIKAVDRAIQLGELTKRIGVVVLIGSRQDRGYQLAQQLIYGYAVPIELEALQRAPDSI
ncbi:MAG: hypothetical protein HOL17_06170 [Gammaproteobacteria bacterium]|jgi:hypothetical protein|nr:hypothetical protein [Gammaproteobacteria bacterium]MBT5371293.1 hypothetical protein [Gammaproteobacteria bacterium]MBT6479397.1 hypothetical protein [Gammaproteobacteria bacterium]MBT7141114.1 hypothetical protein [Gammaproteobacteria bacterium]MBT7479940.1 hypothetical protein [Gammaproteobacteria bacterium]